MDTQELAFRRWCSNHGIGAKALDGQALPAMPWTDLLNLRNELNRAVTASTDGNADLSGQDMDAVDVALNIVANIKTEMDARDKVGNRAPPLEFRPAVIPHGARRARRGAGGPAPAGAGALE